MKLILSLLLIFPILAGAQDCKLINEKDPYTKETKLSSGAIALQGGTVTIDADKKELDFFFEVPGKCYNDMSTVLIFWENSRAKTTYRNQGSMNCDGYFHFKFRNGAATQSVITKMTTQKVVHFIFKGNDDKEVTVSLSPAQQETFMKVVGCINTESKTLLQ